MLVLFETPAGFALFKVLDEGKLSNVEVVIFKLSKLYSFLQESWAEWAKFEVYAMVLNEKEKEFSRDWSKCYSFAASLAPICSIQIIYVQDLYFKISIYIHWCRTYGRISQVQTQLER